MNLFRFLTIIYLSPDKKTLTFDKVLIYSVIQGGDIDDRKFNRNTARLLKPVKDRSAVWKGYYNLRIKLIF